MRQIKFRAWHKVRKEMYEVHGWHSEYVFKKTDDGVGSPGVPDKLEDVELMQYTGLTDKNGKEIYEGDILERIGSFDVFVSQPIVMDTTKKEIIVVELSITKDEYGRQSFGFSINTQMTYSERTHPATYTVISNIYATPELLTKQ